jgi:dienelactone hydrolase
MSSRGTAVLIAAATSVFLIASVGGGLDTAQARESATRQPSAALTPRVGTLKDGADGQGVVIRDVLIRVRHQQPVSAYVVRPTGALQPTSRPGILFLHWLGSIHNDRTEYLGEAVTLAERGVVSVLPQGYFPWVPDPDGTQLDVQRVRDQVCAMRAALDRLVSMRSVDRDRIAIVGHDYGAMYGSLLADSDHRVSVLVLEAPDSTWGNWFATYWLGLEGQARDDYLALFAGLDPVDHTARLGVHVLFQWAGQDVFITPEVQAAFAASSPDAQVLVYPNADHQLTDRAQVDRDAFLAEQLQLP